jgi:hypothetical protein
MQRLHPRDANDVVGFTSTLKRHADVHHGCTRQVMRAKDESMVMKGYDLRLEWQGFKSVAEEGDGKPDLTRWR